MDSLLWDFQRLQMTVCSGDLEEVWVKTLACVRSPLGNATGQLGVGTPTLRKHAEITQNISSKLVSS